MVCSECGLVLESHSIDETSEWRTFASESRVNDPVRVGGPTNPLLTDGGISTVISKPNGVMSNKALLSSSPFKPTIFDSNKSNTGLEDGDGSLGVSGGGKEEIVCRTVEPVWNQKRREQCEPKMKISK